jgi:hypothetical protein
MSLWGIVSEQHVPTEDNRGNFMSELALTLDIEPLLSRTHPYSRFISERVDTS